MISIGALQPFLARAEDRATQRCDPSAVPGAKTEVRAAVRFAAARPSALRDLHQSDKPSRHEAASSSTRCRSSLANARPSKFQFTVNQYTSMRPAGISWGGGSEWETTFFEVTPVSYAQLGLMPQVHRRERDIYGP